MKYSKKIIIGLALCAGIVTSCKEDEAGVSNNISTDKDEITIGPEGGTEQIAVSTNADWVAGSANPGSAFPPQTEWVRQIADWPSILHWRTTHVPPRYGLQRKDKNLS